MNYKIALVLALSLLWITVVHAQTTTPKYLLKPAEATQLDMVQDKEKRPGIFVESEKGHKFLFQIPSFEEMKKVIKERYGMIQEDGDRQKLYQFLYAAQRLCSAKMMFVAIVMAGRADDEPMETFLKTAKDLADKYNFPRFRYVDYQRVVRQGYRTYSSPDEIFDTEFYQCVAFGF